MLDVLEMYLDTAVTPELKDTLVESHKTFERMGLPNYEPGFEELLMLDSNTDSGGTVESIVDLTKSLLHQILLQHEVILNEDTTLTSLNNFTNAILDIAEYDNKTALHDTASLEGSAEEVFAEIVGLVVPVNTDQLLCDIHHIGPAIIQRIKEMAEPHLTPEIDPDEINAHQKYVELFQRFLKVAATEELSVVAMLKNGVSVGYPFSLYISILGRELEVMSHARAARELLGMALISSDGTDKPQQVIKANIDQCISSLDNITKVDIEIGKLILGLQS